MGIIRGTRPKVMAAPVVEGDIEKVAVVEVEESQELVSVTINGDLVKDLGIGEDLVFSLGIIRGTRNPK